jgi:hypothetical protein
MVVRGQVTVAMIFWVLTLTVEVLNLEHGLDISVLSRVIVTTGGVWIGE